MSLSVLGLAKLLVSHSLLCDKKKLCFFCKLLPFYVQFRACLLIPSPLTRRLRQSLGKLPNKPSSQQTAGVFKARMGKQPAQHKRRSVQMSSEFSGSKGSC